MRLSFFHRSSVYHGNDIHTSSWERCVIVWMVLAFFLLLAAAILFAVTPDAVKVPSYPLPSWPF